ncbi:hypothetical protein K9F62_10020 [Desulfovibrio sp. JY]|nr:hypothetical protein K9F62_10020 [Desulfovibrio sp. JY]
MEAQKQSQSAQVAAPAAAGSPLTPDAVASALAVLGEAAKKFVLPASPTTPDPQEPAAPPAAAALPSPGQVIPGELEAMAGTLLLSSKGRSVLKSSPLWTMLGTAAALMAQDPLGLHLAPITQVCITALAGVFLILHGPSKGA